MVLEVISNFRKAKILRRLYKQGLLDVLRTWLSVDATPASEALTDVVLSFLKEQWITKTLISNYDFGIGKAIVKVRKNGSESNKALAEEVQQRWTEILNAKEKEEEGASNLVSLPAQGVPISKGMISLPRSNISVLRSGSYPASDSIALNTRSRRPIVLDDELDYRKRLRTLSNVSLAIRSDWQMDTSLVPVNSPEREKVLWNVHCRRVDKRVGAFVAMSRLDALSGFAPPIVVVSLGTHR